MLHFKKILVPVDFSKESEYSLEWAIRLATSEKGSEIILMNIPVIVPIVEAPYYAVELAEETRARAKKTLEEWKHRVPHGIKVGVCVGEGDPLEDIVSVCEKEEADLVVVTTHGRTGLARMVHPNFSEKVARRAPCPVMVLHLAGEKSTGKKRAATA